MTSSLNLNLLFIYDRILTNHGITHMRTPGVDRLKLLLRNFLDGYLSHSTALSLMLRFNLVQERSL